jgi:hypothetical protein
MNDKLFNVNKENKNKNNLLLKDTYNHLNRIIFNHP